MLRGGPGAATSHTSAGESGDEEVPATDETARGTRTLSKTLRDCGVPAPVGQSGEKVEAIQRAGRSESRDGGDVGGAGLQRSAVDAHPGGGSGYRIGQTD